MSSRTGGTAAIAVLAGCAAALTLSGCYLDVGSLQHRANSYSISTAVRTLVVRAHVGNVEVTGKDVGRVSVTEQISYRHTAPQTTHRMDGDTLTLDNKCPANATCAVAYKIVAPRSTTVDVSANAGGIRLASLTGQVTAHTNAGGIDLSSLSGPIEITNHAGAINGDHISSARANLATSAGAITVTFSAAPSVVTANATVGPVTLHVPGNRAYAVDAHASVGSVQVGVRRDPAAPYAITAHTRTGSVTIQPS